MNRENDIFHQIEADHRSVKSGFEAIYAAPKGAVRRRERLYSRLRAEWKAHSTVEDRVLYSFLQRSRETSLLAERADQAHDTIDDLIEEIDAYTAESDDWARFVDELRAEIDQHIAEEEGDLFAKMRRCFSPAELGTLGKRYAQARVEERGSAAA